MSNLIPTAEAERCASEPAAAAILEAYPARTTDLGTLKIRRALPVRQHRLVGPWCFFDRYGPLSFGAEKPMDVAPHPHIGLQTVSWLLNGEIVHNDSLGCEGLIRPGELSLMTAGHGIAHSEETPTENTHILNGVQMWVALPDGERNHAPLYDHYRELPVFELPGAVVHLILGDYSGYRSPARAFSPMIGAEVRVHPGARTTLPLDPGFEHAILILEGDLSLENQPLAADTLYYLGACRDEAAFSSRAGARLMLIGGAPFGEPILMWWNFVARTSEEIAAARADWESRRRFDDVKAYRGARLPAPPFTVKPVHA